MRVSRLVRQVAHFFTCNDHDLVLFLTMTGRVLGLKAWQIPAAGRTARGVPLVSLLSVSRDEAHMAAVLPVRTLPARAEGGVKQNRLRRVDFSF